MDFDYIVSGIVLQNGRNCFIQSQAFTTVCKRTPASLLVIKERI